MKINKSSLPLALGVLAAFSLLGCSAVGSSSSQIEIDFRNAPVMERGPEVDKTSNTLHSYMVGQLAYAEEDFDRAIANFKKASELGGEITPDLHARLAEMYLRTGNMEDALVESDRAIAAEPDGSYSLLLKAGVLEALKRDDEALPIYTKLMAEQPKLSEPYVLAASLYSRQGDHVRAAAVLKKFLAISPKDPIAHYALARTYEQQGQMAKAEAEYRATAALSPDNQDIKIDLVRSLLRQHKIAQAKAVCEEILKKESGHVVARKILGELAIGSSKFDEALEHLEVVENEERNPIETRFKIALIQVERQNLSEAIRELNLVLAQKPDHAEALYYLGSVYAAVGRNKEAIEEFNKIPKGEGVFVKAMTFASFLLRHLKDLPGAERAARAALEVDPDSGKILSYLVLILREEKKFKEAAALLKQAVDKDPNDDRMLFQYAVVMNERGDAAASSELMEKVIEINPAHSDALNFLAYGLAERGEDLPKAMSLIQRALEINPNDGFYLDTLGWIYFRQGEYEQAEPVLAKAADLTEQDLAVIEHYGDCLAKLGKSKKALEVYRTGIERAKTKGADVDEEVLLRIKEKFESLRKALPDVAGALDANKAMR